MASNTQVAHAQLHAPMTATDNALRLTAPQVTQHPDAHKFTVVAPCFTRKPGSTKMSAAMVYKRLDVVFCKRMPGGSVAVLCADWAGIPDILYIHHRDGTIDGIDSSLGFRATYYNGTWVNASYDKPCGKCSPSLCRCSIDAFEKGIFTYAINETASISWNHHMRVATLTTKDATTIMADVVQ